MKKLLYLFLVVTVGSELSLKAMDQGKGICPIISACLSSCFGSLQAKPSSQPKEELEQNNLQRKTSSGAEGKQEDNLKDMDFSTPQKGLVFTSSKNNTCCEDGKWFLKPYYKKSL